MKSFWLYIQRLLNIYGTLHTIFKCYIKHNFGKLNSYELCKQMHFHMMQGMCSLNSICLINLSSYHILLHKHKIIQLTLLFITLASDTNLPNIYCFSLKFSVLIMERFISLTSFEAFDLILPHPPPSLHVLQSDIYPISET